MNQFTDENGNVLFEVGDLIELVDASKKKLKINVGIVQHISNHEDGDIVYDPGYKKAKLTTWGLRKALNDGKWSVRVITKGLVETLSIFRAPDGTIYDTDGVQQFFGKHKFQLGQRINIAASPLDSLSGKAKIVSVRLNPDQTISYGVEFDDNLGQTHFIEQSHVEIIVNGESE